MKLQTIIPLDKQRHDLIDYKSNLLLIGSCFVENIGDKLNYYKFQNVINPFGILFHPIAIENLILRAINEQYYSEDDVFFYNEQWHCYEAHSEVSSVSKDDLLERLNSNLKLVNQQLKQSSHLVITLGTAWTYRLLATDSIVANCHKIPQKQFVKELLSVDDIADSLNSIIALVESVNPKLAILFTVSPVRHLKDGFVENTQSKSHLITAIHQVVEPRKSNYYFPSYELMMDELRDYRFYKEDMVHPNQLAVNYIWEKFKYVWISSKSEVIMKDVDLIQKGLAHRPFNPQSKQHQSFVNKLNQKIEALQDRVPSLRF